MAKLISWNVNGLRAVVGKGFMDIFNTLDADVFCLQETKLQAGQIELDLPGYEQYWNYAEKKGYSGTAVFTKKHPIKVWNGIGIEEHDQEGRVITLEFEDFFFKVCTLDYDKMSKEMDNLVNLMNKTKNVHIIGPNTDLRFSIEGIPAEKYMGTFNIPDGEVATAPVKNSVNGYITYNTETRYNGVLFNNIRFEFKDGKIVKATSNRTKELNEILDTDEGSRYIGEFALGLNPYIEKPIGDTLFDEKIKGSFHFTPGDSLEESDNGNRSSIHWDIVNIQTPEYGGGEMWFDDVLVRKDGVFVLDELRQLNPENLI